ncbi:hypothetical protein V8C42DRAFT_297271 [Trichoderma barbatum]
MLMLMPNRIAAPPLRPTASSRNVSVKPKTKTMTNKPNRKVAKYVQGTSGAHARASPCVNVTFPWPPAKSRLVRSGLLLANSTLIGGADWPTRGEARGVGRGGGCRKVGNGAGLPLWRHVRVRRQYTAVRGRACAPSLFFLLPHEIQCCAALCCALLSLLLCTSTCCWALSPRGFGSFSGDAEPLKKRGERGHVYLAGRDAKST